MPDSQSTIFATGDDDWKLGVKAHRRNVVRVSLERLHARFRLIIPDLG